MSPEADFWAKGWNLDNFYFFFFLCVSVLFGFSNKQAGNTHMLSIGWWRPCSLAVVPASQGLEDGSSIKGWVTERTNFRQRLPDFSDVVCPHSSSLTSGQRHMRVKGTDEWPSDHPAILPVLRLYLLCWSG